jgi:molecular chaperone DnaJ
MNDPYQILNIPPTATDEEVKRAYRDLARKYHPDNYHDNPLADLAQEKMKVINEAYDQIQKQRKASSAASQTYSYGYGGGNSYGGAYGAGALNQVRMAISRGDISLAERLLSGVNDHNAEWNFLMGVVCSRRGWLDEAKRYMETAVQMEPGNPECACLADRDGLPAKRVPFGSHLRLRRQCLHALLHGLGVLHAFQRRRVLSPALRLLMLYAFFLTL